MNLSEARERLSRAREAADKQLEAERSAEQEIGRLIATGATQKLIEQAKQKYAEASEAATDALRVLPHLEADVKVLEAKESDAQLAARKAAAKKLAGEFRTAAQAFDDTSRELQKARAEFISVGGRANAVARQFGHPGNFAADTFADDVLLRRLHGRQNYQFDGDLVDILNGSILYALEVI